MRDRATSPRPRDSKTGLQDGATGKMYPSGGCLLQRNGFF